MRGNSGIRAVLMSAAIAVCCAPAQRTHAIESDPGTWTIFSTTGSFPGENGPGRWHYWFDAQARYFDPGSGANQWLVRPGIGYEIRDGVKAWAGYARIRSRGRTGLVANENRYWQQIDWRGDAGIGQNRTFLGLGRRISNKLTLEVGYMHQYIFRDSGEDRVNHLALLTIKARL